MIVVSPFVFVNCVGIAVTIGFYSYHGAALVYRTGAPLVIAGVNTAYNIAVTVPAEAAEAAAHIV
jgi:hypothetical protein